MATVANVRAIIGRDAEDEASLPDSVLQTFLGQAEVMWENVDPDGNSGNTAVAVDTIKCYLAAHFWSIAYERGGVRISDVGNTREEYVTGSFAVSDLRLTRFGQQALLFDKSGKLKQLGNSMGEAVFRVF